MKHRIYNKSMYQFDSPEDSLWEATPGNRSAISQKLLGDQISDIAIIGGGPAKNALTRAALAVSLLCLQRLLASSLR